eukprot:NODE_2583_length_505_cov_168.605263_g2052_i0.p1 GENE.NODE_2583_length_505_cov_168.605263_g2052_i0~~NODE_2583_length_505_cov_168.605263_g2052_i0.p1  ORF type:complete len:137 (-),score=27.64 NODE_2583_length_505_cov_168.605263_g2052_i0:93-452(-)
MKSLVLFLMMIAVATASDGCNAVDALFFNSWKSSNNYNFRNGHLGAFNDEHAVLQGQTGGLDVTFSGTNTSGFTTNLGVLMGTCVFKAPTPRVTGCQAGCCDVSAGKFAKGLARLSIRC